MHNPNQFYPFIQKSTGFGSLPIIYLTDARMPVTMYRLLWQSLAIKAQKNTQTREIIVESTLQLEDRESRELIEVLQDIQEEEKGRLEVYTKEVRVALRAPLLRAKQNRKLILIKLN